MKGLRLSVYRENRLGDCTNGGVSARCDELTLVGTTDHDGNLKPLPEGSQVFEATEEAPAVALCVILGVRSVHLRPVEQPEGMAGPMMGGNYAATSDSRFSRAVEAAMVDATGDASRFRFYGAVAVHDRFDTWADYERLGR